MTSLILLFIGESDKFAGRPLYEVIVEEAKKKKMAGATVLRGILGFGAHSRLHPAKILRLSEVLPVVIEIVDESAKINDLLSDLGPMIGEGLVTLEKVRVIAYRHSV